MNNNTKINMILALNVIFLLNGFLSALGNDFLMPGEGTIIAANSEHDLQAMVLSYNTLVEDYHPQDTGKVVVLPYYNDSQVSRETIKHYRLNSFKRLIPLVNEGTQQFGTYHAAAVGTNNKEKVEWTYIMLLDAAAREKALQENALASDPELSKFVSVFGFFTLLILVAVKFTSRKTEEDVNENMEE